MGRLGQASLRILFGRANILCLEKYACNQIIPITVKVHATNYQPFFPTVATWHYLFQHIPGLLSFLGPDITLCIAERKPEFACGNCLMFTAAS